MIPDPPSHLPPPRPDSRETRPPKSKSRIAYYGWRAKMWVEGTLVLHMLEPWEKLLLLFIFLVLSSLFITGLIRFLPHHIAVMQRRTIYYIWGNTSSSVAVDDSDLSRAVNDFTTRSEL
ncbi:hypothetical protein D9758_005693 [Tetrapyrgos nigripes]|uniref:Uncharacterized protein n=1 Tax=Tetrapyrgos nigripes TaxID=182062 RepID=A0A8H5GJZ5_9AGAR|nr:hypothetical protein D9758_005693 [Tetrapyrgos nigripes]